MVSWRLPGVEASGAPTCMPFWVYLLVVIQHWARQRVDNIDNELAVRDGGTEHERVNNHNAVTSERKRDIIRRKRAQRKT